MSSMLFLPLHSGILHKAERMHVYYSSLQRSPVARTDRSSIGDPLLLVALKARNVTHQSISGKFLQQLLCLQDMGFSLFD